MPNAKRVECRDCLKCYSTGGAQASKGEPWTSGLQEGQQVGVDRLRLGSGHTVGKALVGFQRAVLEKRRRQWPRVGIRNYLIVIAMHHQRRHSDLLQVSGEIGL